MFYIVILIFKDILKVILYLLLILILIFFFRFQNVNINMNLLSVQIFRFDNRRFNYANAGKIRCFS